MVRGGTCRVARTDIDNVTSFGNLRPALSKLGMRDVATVEEGVYVWMPGVCALRPLDLKKPNSAVESFFEECGTAELGEGTIKKVDLFLQG